VFVIDRDGLRVQVFTLEGRCLGAIPLAGDPTGGARAPFLGLASSSSPSGKKGGR
jgi:hypothetical protein